MFYSVYYKGTDKKLHNIGVDDVNSFTEAIQAVMAGLHESQEVFILPILCLIKGGKHGG